MSSLASTVFARRTGNNAMDIGRKKDIKDKYERVPMDKLGSGTYGDVYMVRDRTTGISRAMKKIKLTDMEEGIPPTALREISLLKTLPHENVVRLHDVYCRPNEVCLIFEYVESDLKKFMKRGSNGQRSQTNRLSPDMTWDFTKQLLEGLTYCHKLRIIHRDLKPHNLLISDRPGERHILKIADFGLARVVMLPIPKLTHDVVTVWYRPPELLLGIENYALQVDVWSAGCIFAEMACGAPLFMGECEIDTFFKICQKLGTPDESVWAGISELKHYKPAFPKWKKVPWMKIRNLGALIREDGCDALSRMMTYDPALRISAVRALELPYFQTNPYKRSALMAQQGHHQHGRLANQEVRYRAAY